MRRVLSIACVLVTLSVHRPLRAEEPWIVPPTGPTVIHLLRQADVQKELHLDVEQLPRFEKIVDQMRLVLPDLEALSPEERDRKIDELLDNADLKTSTATALAQLLTPAQRTRLNQLLLQNHGIHGFALDSVAERLKLTEPQRQKIRDNIAAHRTAHQTERDTLRAIRKREEIEDGMADVFTPEQEAVWEKELIGPRFDFERSARDTRPVPVRSGGAPLWLQYRVVQQDLQLSPDQKERLAIIREKVIVETPLPQNGDREEARKEATAILRRSSQVNLVGTRAIARLLNREQSHRFDQILLQQRGVRAFREKEMADQLGLTDEQRRRVAELTAPQAPPPRGRVRLTEEERQAGVERRQKIEAQLIELLTPEQQMTWDKMLGPKMDFSFLPNRSSREDRASRDGQ